MNIGRKEYRHIGKKAKEIAKQYSWDLVAKKISVIYEELAGAYGTT